MEYLTLTDKGILSWSTQLNSTQLNSTSSVKPRCRSLASKLLQAVIISGLLLAGSFQISANPGGGGGFVKLIDFPCNKVALAYTPHIVDGMTIEEIKNEIKSAVTLTVIPLNNCYFDIEAVKDSFLKNKEFQIARGARNSTRVTIKDGDSMRVQNTDTDEPDPPNALHDWQLIDAELFKDEYPQNSLRTITTAYTWLAVDNNKYVLEYTIVSSVVQTPGGRS